MAALTLTDAMANIGNQTINIHRLEDKDVWKKVDLRRYASDTKIPLFLL